MVWEARVIKDATWLRLDSEAKSQYRDNLEGNLIVQQQAQNALVEGDSQIIVV